MTQGDRELIERGRTLASQSIDGNLRGPALQMADRLQALSAEVERYRAERDEANMSIIAFCAPHAEQYARFMGLPAGHIDPTHYDILAKAGARMDAFTRADLSKGANNG